MIEITEYVSVYDRASDLGCRIPTGFAMLPDNFATVPSRGEFRYRSEAATVKVLFANHGIPIDDLLLSGERAPSLHNKSFDWGALIFISGALLSSNPQAVSVALGVISNYLTEYFKGLPDKKITLSVVVEKTPSRVCKRVTYEGDIKGLESIGDAVKRIADE
jgi:hypothetical protein